jgi:hypothetical protein
MERIIQTSLSLRRVHADSRDELLEHAKHDLRWAAWRQAELLVLRARKA